MPALIDIVNGALSYLGKPAVTNPFDTDQSTLIAQRIPLFYQLLLRKWTWNFAVKFYYSSTPLTNRISTDFLFNYALPADYGRFWKFSWQMTPQFGLYYQIVDNILQSNSRPIQLWYIVKGAYPNGSEPDFSIISAPFEDALELYTAMKLCNQLTNNQILRKELQIDYKTAIANAIQQNDMERMIIGMPFNDFNRQAYI